jgi:hypothetical protein
MVSAIINTAAHLSCVIGSIEINRKGDALAIPIGVPAGLIGSGVFGHNIGIGKTANIPRGGYLDLLAVAIISPQSAERITTIHCLGINGDRIKNRKADQTEIENDFCETHDAPPKMSKVYLQKT